MDEVKKALLHGSNAVVCTIIQSRGSAPRKAGSRMLVDQEGRTWGSVGGGALEQLCIEKALAIHRTGKGYTQDFDLASTLENGVSMICGGDVTIEFSFLDSLDSAAALLGDGEKPVTVYIFGGGHVGTELVPVLEHLDFRVVVLDDREEFASEKRHPKAYRCIHCNYSDIAASVRIEPEDYVAIMTHGHLNDREILLQVVRTGASYIGCIGSRKKVDSTMRYLLENGVSEEDAHKIFMPIGIDLLGDTPQEIAISIAAQMIRHRVLETQNL